MTRQELEECMFAIRPFCEGALFDGSHSCDGPRSMHEALYKKSEFPRNQTMHAYLDNEINVAIMCQHHHGQIGNSKVFRAWFRELQCQRYGYQAVHDYLMNSPTKIKNM
jgi:hypothetical protein